MKWIPVSERLPELLESVLAFAPDNGEPFIRVGYLHGAGWEVGEHAFTFEQVTHWAKLEPPEEPKP